METNLYSSYDRVAKIYNKPFVEVNDDTARRAFNVGLKDHPSEADFILFKIGTYDDKIGWVTQLDQNIEITSGEHEIELRLQANS